MGKEIGVPEDGGTVETPLAEGLLAEMAEFIRPGWAPQKR